LAVLLGVEPAGVDVRRPFADFGLSSREAVGLLGEIEEWLGRDLPATLIWDHPTIDKLAEHLSQSCGGDAGTRPTASDDDIGAADSATPPEQRPAAVAIVGIGCRFPGAADVESFWKLLVSGGEAVRQVPEGRWNETDALPAAVTQGGFLDSIDGFDAPFFGISPREAAQIDPQHRIVLEVCWDALADAGVAADGLGGSNTGVFIGISSNDYGRLSAADPSLLDTHSGTGNALSMAANRVSYWLDLRGPSLAVDAACSSSLVAVDLACRSLLDGSCELALAGGVNLLVTPDWSVVFERAQMLSPEARCKTFDADADGYVRGEGCGVVVLKRLSRALADGDTIRAVILASAVGQDGRSNGITAPNGSSQERVIRQALHRADVRPEQIGYFEAHGTGTPLGDPIEVGALKNVLNVDEGAGGGSQPAPWIGSVKTNFGHLEAAAGIAGLIKAALMVERGRVVPHLHFRRLNPHIESEGFPFRIATKSVEWPGVSGPRVCGVSAFGFGGTNAHVILAEVPATEAARPTASPPEGDLGTDDKRPVLVPLSAADPEALRQLAADLADATPSLALADISHTTSLRRAHLGERLAIVAGDNAELTSRVRDWLEYASTEAVLPGIRAGRRAAGAERRLAFVFSGQGGHWPGMGVELFDHERPFRDAIERAATVVERQAGWSLIDALHHTDNDRQAPRPEIDQPLLLALQLALVELLESWGIIPSALVGHSLGEVTAALVAGALDLEQAIEIAVARGCAIQEAGLGGAMAAVGLSAPEARRYLEPFHDQLDIAAINSPTAISVSGDVTAIDELLARLEADGIRHTRLTTDYASHGPAMEEPARRLVARLAGLRPHDTALPLVSTTDGTLVQGAQLGAEYWGRNLRQPVLFERAVRHLAEEGFGAFVEIGPHPLLKRPLRECLADDAVVVATLRRDGGREAFLETVAELWCAGIQIDWRAQDGGGRLTRLPGYPFQRERCWVGEEGEGTAGALGPDPATTSTSDAAAHETLAVGTKSPAASTRSELAGRAWERALGAARRQSEHGPLDLDPGRWEERWQALDRLAAAYIRRTLDQLESRHPGSTRSAASLVEDAGVLPEYHDLMQRWLLGRASEPGTGGVTDLETEARRILSGNEFLFEYVARCGNQLTEVLGGEINPLETLFPDSSYATVDALYHDWAVARYFNNMAAAAIEQWTGTMRALGTPRILEVGAGTGGMTRALLPLLGDDFSYRLTDVSAHFFHRLRDRLGDRPQLAFGLFDLERDPGAQGLEPCSFDIVVAANVLHATTDLRRTLANVKSLLAPGGLLVLYEVTTAFRWLDISVGLIEGWRAFDDDLRRDGPLLDAASWANLLRQVGFAEVGTLPDPDSIAASLGQSVVLARAADDARVVASSERSAASWLHVVSWHEQPLPVTPDGRRLPGIGARRRRLIVGPTGRLGSAVEDLYGAEGIAVEAVENAGAPTNQGGAPGVAEAIAWLDAQPSESTADILFLSAAGDLVQVEAAGGDGPAAAPDPATAATASSAVLLELARALQKHQRRDDDSVAPSAVRARLWVVTRRAHRLAQEVAHPEASQTALWGLGRALGSELGASWGGLVDVEGIDEQADARHVDAELRAAEGQNGRRVEAAWRGGERFCPSLERLRRSDRADNDARTATTRSVADGTILISGGTGVLGLAAAHLLVDRGARRLVLVSRSTGDDDESVGESIAALRRHGAEVRTAAADITNFDAVAAIVAAIGETGWPPLRGVIHTAGLLGARPLADCDGGFHRQMLAAKVTGAWNLHRCTAAHELDFFVLFSSAAALFGPRGHACYATANAFLDGLAAQRRAAGLTATSIAWGVWELAGADARATVARYGSLGLERIDVGRGMQVLAELIDESPAQVAVLPGDAGEWCRFAPEVAASPLLAASAPLVAEVAPVAEGLAAAVISAEASSRAPLVQNLVRQRIAAVLHLPPERIEPRRSLFDLGFDSLMALDLKSRLESDLGLEIPVSRLLKRPEVEEIGVVVCELLEASAGKPRAALSARNTDGWETFRI